MTTATARRYRMTRVGKGDYLLPSNDATRLYRISSYEEDGSASWTDRHGRERFVFGTFWSAHIYRGTLEEAIENDDLLEWGTHWVEVCFGQKTRAAVIEEALRR